MKFAVVKNAGSSRANQVLAGVYGQVTRNESGNPRFKIDPEFTRISYLFSLLENGTAPVEINDIQEVEVPDAIATSVKGTLIHLLGARWDSLYRPGGNHPASMVSSMLANEGGLVMSGARSHLASMGMRGYDVQFAVEAKTRCRSTDIATMSQLARNMEPTGRPEIVGVTDLDSDMLARQPTPVPDQTDEGENMGIDEAREWSFEGHSAAGKLISSITVVAINEDAARQVASEILGISEAAVENQTQTTIDADGVIEPAPDANNRSVNSIRDITMFQALTAKPLRVENIRMGEAVVFNEHEDDEDLDDEYDRPRD